MKWTMRALAGLFLLGCLVADAEALPRRIGSWLVCGTFPCADEQAFLNDVEPPAALAPAAGATLAGRAWQVCDDRLYCRNHDDFVDLFTFFGGLREGVPAQPTDQHFAYAHCYVWSPRAQAVQLRIGANDGYRAWLNGQVVATAWRPVHGAVRDGEASEIALQAGWNRLLLKVWNGWGIWGFYCQLTDAAGAPLTSLAYSIDPPEGPLRVVTRALPAGYTRQPYVWLDVESTRPTSVVPSASPLRLQAAGGTPPYRWTTQTGFELPAGLYLDGAQGEILGLCPEQAQTRRVVFVVTDSAGTTARQALALHILPRPTLWFEQAKLGGLFHGARGYRPPHGDPREQARLMKLQGYAWGAPTSGWLIQRQHWRGDWDEEKFWTASDVKEKFDGKPALFQDVQAYADALRGQGIRFGSYVGLFDNLKYVFDPQGKHQADNWARYQDALHAFFLGFGRAYRPSLYYLDGAHETQLDGRAWDFDPLYSLIKTLDPACLVMPNQAALAGMDDGVGDADVVSAEGINDSEPVWARWPQPRAGRNPKYIPVESWRMPFAWAMWDGTDRAANRRPGEPDYLEPTPWLRAVVSLIGEGYGVDLDHSFGHGSEAMHERLGQWLQPRLEALVGTEPLWLEQADWGYALAKGDAVYLHVLENPRGKRGFAGRPALTLEPFARPVRRVRVWPHGRSLKFEQRDGRLTIDVRRVKADPVVTILRVDCRPAAD